MKKILTGILVSLFIVTGCNDEEFLTPDRAPQQPWDNVGEFEMAVTAAYNKTFYGGWGGRYYMTDRVIMEGMTDVLYMMPATSEDYPQTEVYYRQTEIVNVGRVEGAFGSAYSCINNINSALDFYYNPTNWVENEEEHPFYDLTAANEAILKRQVGELHLLRAYAYFHLTLMHCPPPGGSGFSTSKILPYRKEWTYDVTELRVPELASAKKIYDSIILPDLDKAISLIPENFTDNLSYTSSNGRANKYAAKAVAAQVYFQLGAEEQNYWTEALTKYLDDITSWPYQFQEPAEPFLRASSVSIDNTEIIWESVYFDKTNDHTPRDATLLTWNRYRSTNQDPSLVDPLNVLKENRCSWHVFSMSYDAIETMGWLVMSDPLTLTNEAKNDDKRYQQMIVKTTPPDTTCLAQPWLPQCDSSAIYETKFPQVDRSLLWIHKYYRGSDGKYTNVPVIRLPEVYLIKAIIENELGQDDNGLGELNDVRNARGLTSLGAVTASDIEAETVKELIGEGFRFRYLKALKKQFDQGDDDGTMTYELDGQEYSVQGRGGPYSFDDSKLYWQIPQNEQFYQVQ